MDGLGGLLFAAEKIGALVTAGGSVVDLGYLLSQCVELCGEKETLEALRAAGQRNPRIEAYRLAVETERRPETGSGERDRIKTLSYEQLKRELSAVKLYRLWAWGEHASDDDLGHAARGLIAAQDAAWGPIQHEGKLHDRASYRYYWELLQRAQATGMNIADDARQRFFS